MPKGIGPRLWNNGNSKTECGDSMNLPEQFSKRMKNLLGTEYEDFLGCYQQEKKQGLRVNTGKISVEDFLKITPFTLTPIPWTENGFFYREEDRVTRHPHYYGGLYYVQEPSAMVPAGRLPIEKGDRVLDLCAAPGGKATELGAKLGGTGVLVANDVSASRAGALLKNLELFGIRNAFVTAETPQKLLQRFGAFFDKILVDAPCSGEGMFRKSPALIKSWKERGPEYYAPLQKDILSCAVRMLRPGGMLLYSTCTFSPEEDEQVIADTLEQFPELELADPDWYPGFSGGFPVSGKPEFAAEKCIRIWPHRMEGEGHFAALLRKKAEKQTEKQAEKQVKRLEIQQFFPEALQSFEKEADLSGLGRGVFLQKQENLFLIPEDFPMPSGLRYLRTGLLLGTEKKKRFEPSQALAMAISREDCTRVLDLSAEDPAVIRYLKGETLEIQETAGWSNGWVLVCCDGYPLGWGKHINGSIRNKYLPGWRYQ